MRRLIELYQAFLDHLERAALVFTMVMTAALLVVNSGGIIFELIAGNSLVWVEEISNLLFAWAVFVGAGAIARRGGHIGVDMLHDYLPAPLMAALNVLIAALALIIVWVMVYYGHKMALFVGRSQSSVYLDINLYYYYLSIPVGGVILGLVSIGTALPGSPPKEAIGSIKEN